MLQKDALVAINDGQHGVVGQSVLYRCGQGLQGVDDGGKPKPKLQHHASHLAHIPEEHVQRAQKDTQSKGEQDLQRQQGQCPQNHPAGPVAADQQKRQIQRHDDAEVDQRRAGDDGGQADAGEAGFFDEVGVVQKHGVQAAQHFGKQPPSQHARAQIDAEGQGVVLMPRQAGAHELAEDDGVNQDHGQGVEHGPQRAKERCAVFAMKLALDAGDH